MLDSFGTLSVRTFTAGGALPVPNAIVRITGAEEENRHIVNSLLTDINGKTPTVTLPTPGIGNTLTPTPPQIPYAIYDIQITAPGYFSKKINSVPIFSGIYSLQPVNMIPETSTGILNYPRGNVNVIIPESQL